MEGRPERYFWIMVVLAVPVSHRKVFRVAIVTVTYAVTMLLSEVQHNQGVR